MNMPNAVNPVKLMYKVQCETPVPTGEKVVIEDKELAEAFDLLMKALCRIMFRYPHMHPSDIQLLWERMALHALTGEDSCWFFGSI